jgi:integrase
MGQLMGGAVAKLDLDYVDVQKDRCGRIAYYYFRRRGRRWKLPGEPFSEEFMAEYRRLLEATGLGAAIGMPIDRRDYAAGSFGALINDYLRSAAFKEKKPRTQAEYQRVLEDLQSRKGHNPLKLLRRRHIRQIRDERAETPGAANTILRMLKLVLNFAVDEELIEANPAAKMKELKVGEWRAWTDEDCAQFEERWAPGTMQRRAYALALYTGQRKQDQITRTRTHRRDGGIWVVQSKTDEELWIPEHRELTAELARGIATIDTLLVTPTQGKPFDDSYYGSWFADAIDEAGLPDDCVLHGLRKCAARKLADLGLSEEMIKSITGHVTSRMVAKYVKGANQRKLATAAMKRWENAK